MFIDTLLKVSTAQAFGAGAVSTSSIDLGTPGGVGTPIKRQIANGEPMGFAFTVDVAATVAVTTVEIISTTDAALTAALISHVTVTIPLATAVAGYSIFIPLPQDGRLQRFVGIRTATAGGTISASASLTAHSLFSLAQTPYYAKNFTV